MEWLDSLRDSLGNHSLTEKRKTYRVACSLPVTIQTASEDAIAGQLTNLSTTGLKFKLPQMLKPGADYTLLVQGQPGPDDLAAPQLTIQGQCIWCRKAAHGDGYEVGYLFTGFVGVHMGQVLDFFRKELHIGVTGTEPPRPTPRLSHRVDITFVTPEGREAHGFIRNLHDQQVHLASRTHVDQGQDLTLTVDLGDGTSLPVPVHILQCRKVPREDWFELDATFQPLVAADHQRLMARWTSLSKSDP